MNNSLSKPLSTNQQSNISPFARAMAEAKSGDQNSSFTHDQNRLSDLSPDQLAERNRLQQEKMRRERLRQELHRQVNPVETTDVYNAERQRVKKQIEEIRHDLQMMVQEVANLHEDIEISLMSNVPDAGQQGKYYFNFFEKLRNLIQLLRQQIHSAHTWATTLQSKKKKKKGKTGLEIGGQQYEQTTTVFDRMHHERSTQYSGS